MGFGVAATPAAASQTAGVAPALEDLPLRFLTRHPPPVGRRQASRASPSGTGAVVGTAPVASSGAGTWRLAYRHWLPPPPLQQAPDASRDAARAASDLRAVSGLPQPRHMEEKQQQRPHPCVLFCNGLKSEMAGSKVRCTLQEAAAAGCEFLCFDYSGFGASSGRPFESCGLTDWIQDTEALLREVVAAPHVVLLGSSIGGWVALRVAQREAEASQVCSSGSSSGSSIDNSSTTSSSGPRISGLLLVAPAVDLSEVRWAALTQQQRDSVTAAAAALAAAPATTGVAAAAAASSKACEVSGSGAERESRDVSARGLVSLGSPYSMPGGDWVGPAYFAQGRQHLLLTMPWGSERQRQPAVVVNEGQPAAADEQRPGQGQRPQGQQQVEQQGQQQGQPPLGGGRSALLAGAEVVWRRPLEVAVPVPSPVLVMAGSEDEVVPLALVRALADGINASAAASSAAAGRDPASGTAQQASPRRQCDGGNVAGGGRRDEQSLNGPSDGAPRVGERAATSGLSSGEVAAVAVTRAAGARAAAGCELHVVEGGDHRLSDAGGLEVMRRLLGRLLMAAGEPGS
ncbi:hypothetical protein HYH02_000236 [Chlamydomonas schloesseri]|uniref:Serine aminopeptidase S33 domain-containing protein n=1 Tax=Chlamydomonas schloesseri TaxID=2026947 RepID=A0A835WLT7_9CHLO|nr:hypothetical protein HYH02_000236 [Chlamydomonas schloesseri]|eukprot:KAG2450133.1 hypothetical protein HYH02_000236 [Chlamydomonas schloesseri]